MTLRGYGLAVLALCSPLWGWTQARATAAAEVDSACMAVSESIAQQTLADPLCPGEEILPVSRIPRQEDTAGVSRTLSSDWWWNRIKAGTYNIKDPGIDYPAFLGFCARVYNWGDAVFNTYDPEYVKGTGKNWKVFLKQNNWTDSYVMELMKTPITMLSDVQGSFGPNISFMAVSVGYEANINQLITHRPQKRKYWSFNFNTALFWVNAYYRHNRDGTVVRSLGDYRNERGRPLIHEPLPNLGLKSMGLDMYYFVNHGRYSHGAAYNFSRLQLRSQGSLLVGASISHQEISFNLDALPSPLLSALPKGFKTAYNFDYNDYCLLVGYGYNFVLGRHWLLNLTGLPNFGLKRTLPGGDENRKHLFALNGTGTFSAVYNCGSIFAGAFASGDMHWYNSSRLNFANAVLSLSLQVGYRF